MNRKFICTLIVFGTLAYAQGQMKPYSQQLAETAIKLWPDSFSMVQGRPARWSYDQGVILKGVEGIWTATGDGRWFNYIQKSMDHFIQDDGSVKTYKLDDYNIDNVNNGRQAILLYRVTGKEKYKKAADMFRKQLAGHPRTSEGGFWHKKVYPNQMWLDGLYMGEPFYAEYASVFHEDAAFNDITRQFVLMETHARDPKTGLLYHGWDASREQRWADKTTGQSPNFWTRALGWYGMALVDALDYFPNDHKGRDSLIFILNRFAKAVVQFQDKETGLWYDVTDKNKEPRNYFEASGSAMLVYTLAKASRKNYIPVSYRKNALKGYSGLLSKFIVSENGQTDLKGTVSVSGLGGNPYRDGSFDYYMSEKVITNDPKGMGAFINAAVEVEMIPNLAIGTGKTVLLDQHFNNEIKKDATGANVNWHYTWSDRANSGYSTLGSIFNRYGASLASTSSVPDKQVLKGASVYIIVDPDTEKETPAPNYMTDVAAAAISDWVKAGGILILLTNDAGNAELKKINLLAGKFGVTFNEDNYNLVKNDDFPQGVVLPGSNNAVFTPNDKFYIKELATLNIASPAKAVLTKDNKNVAAVAKHGKGMVFIMGDPWIYNEYVDGRKLPADFKNYQGAESLVRWSLLNAKKK